MSNQGLAITLHGSPGSSVFDLPTQPSTSANLSSNHVPHSQLQTSTTRESGQCNQPASYVVISGGTGGNAICSAFENACYVLPVSDDGGSSSEIIRVLGGPSIGDIRSRLIRLIPPALPYSPLDSIRCLLAHRLPSQCSERDARDEWRDIVEGRSTLWKGIPSDRKETIRGFLVYFESELLRRAHKNFDFRNGSIGNYFLAAAQGFFRSLPSAIFLFSSITNSQANILPVIVTNHTVTIAAELEDGSRLVGQCEISHPIIPTELSFVISEDTPSSPIDGLGEVIAPRQNVMFQSIAKGAHEPLRSRISRLYYINGYGMEVHPSPNADFLSNLASRDTLVYSCGSLWTSIMPCLALKGVAAAIARSPSLRVKVLLLNIENDRETPGYTASDYIQVIVRTLNTNYSTPPYGLGGASTVYPVSAFITDVVYMKGTQIPIDVKLITRMGVRCRQVEGGTRFTADILKITRPHPSKWRTDSLYKCIDSRRLSPFQLLKSPSMVAFTTPDRQNHFRRPRSFHTERSCAFTTTKCPVSTPTVVTSDDIAVEGLDISDAVIHTPCAITPTPEDVNNGTRLVPPEGNPACPLHVRFRPRVRITSGLNRHRRQQGWLTVGDQQDSSSRPGSASSSVSAPLRTRFDDEVGKPGWGTLGQRVSLLAKRKKSVQETRESELHAKINEHGTLSVVNGTNERTPLLNSYLLYHDEDDGSSLSKLVDRVFGPWPVRLLNHHWWWWQMEPIVCCVCLDDSDEEG